MNAFYGPLFEFAHTRDEKGDRAERFGDPEHNSQLLRISHMSESLNRLRTARQVGECTKER